MEGWRTENPCHGKREWTKRVVSTVSLAFRLRWLHLLLKWYKELRSGFKLRRQVAEDGDSPNKRVNMKVLSRVTSDKRGMVCHPVSQQVRRCLYSVAAQNRVWTTISKKLFQECQRKEIKSLNKLTYLVYTTVLGVRSTKHASLKVILCRVKTLRMMTANVLKLNTALKKKARHCPRP